jgi:hypothetical protein
MSSDRMRQLGRYNKKNEAVGKRSLRKVRNKWLGNVKMDLGGRCYEDVDWIYQAKNRDKR